MPKSLYKILIVEDSEREHAALRNLLIQYAKDHELEFELFRFRSAEELVASKRTFDLVFLDIDLPGISGMDGARLFRSFDSATPLVFVTNLSQYALHGYEVGALDFMVKPVTFAKLILCMDRALAQAGRETVKKHIISLGGGIRVIESSDICWVELVRHDLVYHFVSGDEPLKVRGTVGKLEDELSGDPFLRISSGCIVNMDHIRLAKGSDIRMSTGDTLALSRGRKKDALAAFARYLNGDPS